MLEPVRAQCRWCGRAAGPARLPRRGGSSAWSAGPGGGRSGLRVVGITYRNEDHHGDSGSPRDSGSTSLSTARRNRRSVSVSRMRPPSARRALDKLRASPTRSGPPPLNRHQHGARPHTGPATRHFQARRPSGSFRGAPRVRRLASRGLSSQVRSFLTSAAPSGARPWQILRASWPPTGSASPSCRNAADGSSTGLVTGTSRMHDAACHASDPRLPASCLDGPDIRRWRGRTSCS